MKVWSKISAIKIFGFCESFSLSFCRFLQSTRGGNEPPTFIMSHRGYPENKLRDIDQAPVSYCVTARDCRRRAYLFRKNISNLSSVNITRNSDSWSYRRFPCLFNRLQHTRKPFVFILSIKDVKGFSFRLLVWNLKLLFILHAVEREKRMLSGAKKKIRC